MPIFSRSYQKVSSWAASKARNHKSDTPDEATRFDSARDTGPRSGRLLSKTLLRSGGIEIDGHSDDTQMLESNSIRHSSNV